MNRLPLSIIGITTALTPLAYVLVRPASAYAQFFKSFDDAQCVVDNVPTFNCLPVVINNVVVFFLIAAAVATLFMLIYGGIKYSLSGGDPKKVSAARSTIMYAVLGLALVFLSFIIIRVVSSVTGNKEIDPTQSQFDFSKPLATPPRGGTTNQPGN